MGHIDTELSTRFAKSCTTAAFGYARAATAAYAALADQALDFWTQAAKPYAPADDDTPRLSLVAGPRPYRSAVSEASMPVDFVKMSNAWAASPMFASVRAWWGLFPLEGNPTSWPMAYAMMTAGVPRTVALPAAEANMAAMDAAELVSQSFDRSFSSYRSESGYAVAQIVMPNAWLGALLLTPAVLKFPWAA
jgi:hypothetical protein